MEYTSEEMQVLLRQESTTYATHDYLNSSACCPLMVDSHKFAQRPSSDDDSDSRNTRMKSESSYHRESKKRKLRQGYPQLTADMNSHHEDVRRRQLWREKVCEWVYQGEKSCWNH